MDCLISIDVMIFNCNFQFDIPKWFIMLCGSMVACEPMRDNVSYEMKWGMDNDGFKVALFGEFVCFVNT